MRLRNLPRVKVRLVCERRRGREESGTVREWSFYAKHCEFHWYIWVEERPKIFYLGLADCFLP